jgi:hypothetical protein
VWRAFEYKNPLTLSYGEGFIGTEDLGEEDIIGLVLGFEFVATDGGRGGAQVAWSSDQRSFRGSG